MGAGRDRHPPTARPWTMLTHLLRFIRPVSALVSRIFHARLESFFAWLVPLRDVLLGLVTFISSSSASHPNEGRFGP